MRYGEWDRYEPPAIRGAVPLAWAVGYLFGAWDAGADMTPCPLPGHQDDTPSFNLWASDEDGYPQRFGCFGCAENGDVVDLVRLARGVGFLDACRIAVDDLVPALEASSWQPAELAGPVRAAANPADLERVVSRIQGHEDLPAFVARKFPDAPERFVDYVRMAWGWGTFRTPAPTAYFPHRDWSRRLTGIRYRSIRRESTRWAESGSRFPALYGAWRDLRRPRVLLCEGETDTVWAAWSVEDRVDVFGLPAGAAQRPPEQALLELAGRHVSLAFDGDLAGRIATARWRDALGAAHVVPIPDGEDLLSCGIPVSDLLAEAR